MPNRRRYPTHTILRVDDADLDELLARLDGGDAKVQDIRRRAEEAKNGLVARRADWERSNGNGKEDG